MTVFGDFEWDDAKAAANQAKHGVSFEEAATVFLDLDYLLASDPGDTDHSHALGYSVTARMLLVVHLERGQRIRIVSARPATPRERKAYEQRRFEA